MTPVATTTKIVDMVKDLISIIKSDAQTSEDGNTVALLDKVERDINQLQPAYTSKTLGDIVRAQVSEDAQANDADDADLEPGPSFTPQSYEKTGAEGVNKKPLPPTGEESSAPFVSKAEPKVVKANTIK